MTVLSRRGVLTGAAVALASGCTGSTAAGRAGVPAGRFASGRFTSRLMGAPVGWSIAYPPGHRVGDALPVVVALHGRGGSHTTTFDVLHLGTVLDDLVNRRRVAPFALASVDGGDHGYWHRRDNGTDAGAMVVEEFVPLLARRGLDTRRLGLYGWSMGGYGALLLAGRHALPVRAVAVASPALFTTPGQTPSGAFDSAADYRRNDVFGEPDRLAGVPVRIDCGQSDPFYEASRAFAARLRPPPATSFGPGAHDAAYWRKVAPAELGFLGSHLG
jgi:enterochelin esterase-like enzyme